MDSLTGLLVQIAGISLITLLYVFLKRTLKSVTLNYWTFAWGALVVSLTSLLAGAIFRAAASPFFFLYYFGGYVFCLMLIAGSRNYVSDIKISRRYLMLLIPAALMALGLTLPYHNIVHTFHIHAFVMALSFGSAFRLLLYTKRQYRRSFGLKVMRIILLVLALDFACHSVVFMLSLTPLGIALPPSYLTYVAVVNAVLEVLLGFSMVIMLLEKVIQEGEKANRKLQAAHFQLEQLVQTDPLTTAFNRHAFYSYLQKQDEQKSVRGCVCVMDIDNLKPINDMYGHSAGDLAIRAVATEVRALIRADDLLFRWGGDEFFVIMVGMNEELADLRFSTLETSLMDLNFHGVPQDISIRVSYGISEFGKFSELENAIERADGKMYQQKMEHKQSFEPHIPLYQNENIAQITIPQ